LHEAKAQDRKSTVRPPWPDLFVFDAALISNDMQFTTPPQKVMMSENGELPVEG
jgi:hypothetical protein